MSNLTPVLPSVNPARIAREVIETNPEISGWDFARACVAVIDEADYKAFLLQMFYSQYSGFVGSLRNAAIQQTKNSVEDEKKDLLPAPQTFLDSDGKAPPLVGPARWKLDNFWRQRIPVGQEGYKFLGDLTVDDLNIVIAMREGMAVANQRRADEFRAVRDYMIENKLRQAKDVGEKAKSLLVSLS